MSLNKKSKIYVAGHTGLVGSSIVSQLKRSGYTNILMRSHKELDLLNQKKVFKFLENEKPEFIFIAAAKVGGIYANNTYRADFIYENLVIETNLIHGAFLAGVKKLIFLGSSCIYPKNAPQPMLESCLLTSELEYTNEPYAIAKIAGIKLCESYNMQYGTCYISLMPTNLYGRNDNYDFENSHVLPALIRKFHIGKCLSEGDWTSLRKDLKLFPIKGLRETSSKNEIINILSSYGISLSINKENDLNPDNSDNSNNVTISIWGTGTPRREFLHSDDLANACVFIMEKESSSDKIEKLIREKNNTHINIGTGTDISIRELSEIIMKVVEFKGKIIYDSSKPDGTMRKLQNVNRIHDLGWRHCIEIEEGISKIYNDYRSN